MAEVWIIGGGPAELASALELAEVGLSVRVAEGPATDRAWGALAPEGVPDPDGALRALLEHAAAPLQPGGQSDDDAAPVATKNPAVLLRAASGAWAPQPEPSVLGIPAVPLAAESLALMGTGPAMRAYLDRVKPVLTIGKTHALGELVRSRLGKSALERLVEPLVRERFGVGADDVDVAIAAPGLNEDLTTAGSLSGAVLNYSERGVARETLIAPKGGWAGLRAAMRRRLELYGAEFVDETVTELRRADEGWLVVTSDGAESEAAAAVVGYGPDTVDLAGMAEELARLAPAARRVEIRIPIADPGFPAGHETWPAVESIELPGTGIWSVRLERGAAGWLGIVRSPAMAVGQVPALSEAEILEYGLTAVTTAGAEADAGRSGDIAIVRGIAPYGKIAARDAEASRLAVWRAAHDDALPVGPELHGGDVADAIADAREAAVTLRRRLTGIAE